MTTIAEPMLIDRVAWLRLLHDIDTVICDADGVLWLGNRAIDGAVDLLNELRTMGKQIYILTNNSSKTRAAYVDKCVQLGFNGIDTDHIVSPSAICIDYLKRHSITKVYVIGVRGLMEEFDAAAIDYVGGGADHFENNSDDSGSEFLDTVELDPQVQAVVVGYDNHFNYVKLMKATNYLRAPDCHFIITNEDDTFPGANKKMIIPGTGAITAAVRHASSGREPIVLGKPSPLAFEYIRSRWSVDPQRTLMIGDRCNTDIKFGRTNGLHTLHVLSGVHSLDDVHQFQSTGTFDCVPHYYAPSLGALR